MNAAPQLFRNEPAAARATKPCDSHRIILATQFRAGSPPKIPIFARFNVNRDERTNKRGGFALCLSWFSFPETAYRRKSLLQLSAR